MRHSTLRPLSNASVTTALALLVSCATSAPPERMETSAATIRAAQEVGSAGVPQAALHVQLAREQAEQAKGLLEKGERERAESVFARAQADADLGLALAREDADRAAAQQALDEVRTLQAGK